MNKKVLGGLLCFALIAGCCTGFVLLKKMPKQPKVKEEPVQAIPAKKPELVVKTPTPKIESVRNAFNEIQTNQISFSVLKEVSKLPDNIYNKIKEIIDNGDSIYYLKQAENRIIIIKDNHSDNTHGIEIIEILHDGNFVKNPKFQEFQTEHENSEFDEWIFDEDEISKFPLKHTKFSKDGEVEYTETWNYSDNEPIKYEMKNGEDKVLSIKKETLENDTSLRTEHLFYDKEGNTKISISVTYEGAEVKRFTYYNADKPKESGSVFSEFEDGIKTKETVYSSDFKLEKTYQANYENGSIVKIEQIEND